MDRSFDLVVDALEYAALMHAGQRRKGRGRAPYINHPISVMALLHRAGVTDPAVLAAALLHDTVEDTEASREDLAERFGEPVAAIVAEVTDDKSLPQAERKQAQIDKAPHLSLEARLVKLADKTANVSDLVQAPPDWPRERLRDYTHWAAAVVAPMRGTHAALEAAFDKAHAQALSAIG